MATNNPDENLPGPFKNGRLTDPDEPGDTRPNRIQRPASNEPAPNEQDSPGALNNEQTLAIPVRPKSERTGQTQANPVYDPHGQTQGLPSYPAASQPGQTRASQAQPAHGMAGPVRQNEAGLQPTTRERLAGLRPWIRRNWWWGAVAIVLFGMMIASGGYSGFLSGQAERRAQAEAAAINDLTQQVSLGFEDLQAGRFDVARQRFEFVLNQDPNFPGAADGLVQALQVLNATATPTPPPATPTLTPTRDLRPVEELLAQALAQMKNSDWAGVIQTLNGLRKEDPNYQVTRVDGYLYIALRYQGVDKILNQSDLEGGIYDLALAEQFGPLDAEALGTRNLARLYIIGSSFWEAMPEQAVYYFSQVAAAAPYLRDASGWTARERYRQSLVQYGDRLAASENWCEAQDQYETALSMQDDAAIAEKAQEAAVACAPPTATPTLTPTETPTLTLTPTATLPGETTAAPTTPVATTPVPTTEVPPPVETTPVPTTAVPTTAAPTTAAPTIPAATTPAPTTEAPPPAETTPAPPPESPTPTDTTAPPPVEPPTATAPASLLETPPETSTETLSAPPADDTPSPAPSQAPVGWRPAGERTAYA